MAMIYSMTGFGKAEASADGKKITVEVKSLNSKQLDMNFRLPSFYRERELELRNIVANLLTRGKVDVSINVETEEESVAVRINTATFKAYYHQISALAAELGLSEANESIIQTILRLPEVLRSDKKEVSDNEWAALMQATRDAATAHIAFREQEGLSLEVELSKRVNLILEYLLEIEKHEPTRLSAVKQKLMDALASLSSEVKVDKDRFEQELIYYIEKLDVTEEKVRLRNHCSYFMETMKSESAPGRKLGFIAQEMGREINTLGSKSNEANMQKVVVRMKDELEKIKEQVLNVL